jgi:flagellar hook-associated protein 2
LPRAGPDNNGLSRLSCRFGPEVDMGTTSNALFNGTSRYSQDFQAVLQRTVAIASLPITQLNEQKTQVADRSTALSGLDTKFQALAAAVTGIENAFGWASYQATVSDPTKLSVTLGDGAVGGNYSVNITQAGAYATSITQASWAANSGSYQLSLNGTLHDLTPADSSAGAVAAAINAAYGDQVRATVINVGSADVPDYRISLQGTRMEALAPDILFNSSSLQDQTVTGQTVQYVIDNSSHTGESSSPNLTIATGLTVNLASGTTGAVTIQITRSPSALGNALANFANAYNAAVDELNKQHGSSAGALSGDSVVDELSQALRTLSTYSSPSGDLFGLNALGLDLGSDGHLTFDSAVFNNAATADPAGVDVFFGSATTGGFLKLASDTMNLVQQTGSGILPSAESLAQTESADLDARIAQEQTRVDFLQQQLQERMAAADALVASMEQQYTYITGMFQAMQEAAKQWQ